MMESCFPPGPGRDAARSSDPAWNLLSAPRHPARAGHRNTVDSPCRATCGSVLPTLHFNCPPWSTMTHTRYPHPLMAPRLDGATLTTRGGDARLEGENR